VRLRYAKGLNAGTVHHVRRTLNKTLNDAVRRGRLLGNPVALANTPRYDPPDVEPLTVDEARTLLVAAADEPNGAAFMLAISLGLRRGEVLGLMWDDVDLDAGRLSVRRQLERRNWKHGCPDPDRCDDQPSRCPQRTCVLTNLTGRAVSPHDHSLHWTAFLERSGVRPARLHDARHTAATFLLVQGVDQRVVMDMLGWTSPTMTARYQHVVPELVEEANRRMSELLWGEARPK
jgi:integrase